jgi:SSS family solute:Na+ symporter
VPAAVTKLVDGKPVTTTNGTRHFGSSLGDFPFTSTKVYIAGTALLINVLVAVIFTLILRAVKAPGGTDETEPDDYYSDAADPKVVSTAKRETAGAEAGSGG